MKKVAILKKKKKPSSQICESGKLKAEQRTTIGKAGGFRIVSGAVSGASSDGALEKPRLQAGA